MVNQLRFGDGLGVYSVSAAPDSVMIAKGMGMHHIQVQLQVGIPEVDAAAGRLLVLETTLYAPRGTTGGSVPLASANVSAPFNSGGRCCCSSSLTPRCRPSRSTGTEISAWSSRLTLCSRRPLPLSRARPRSPSTSPSPRADGASSWPGSAAR